MKGGCRLFPQCRLFRWPALKTRGNLRKRKNLVERSEGSSARLDAAISLPPSLPNISLGSSWKDRLLIPPPDILFRIRPHSKLIKRHAHRLAFFRGTKERIECGECGRLARLAAFARRKDRGWEGGFAEDLRGGILVESLI